MKRRLTRVLQMLALLEGGVCATTKELAECLHVSRRTIFRDLALLRDAGFPIELAEEQGGRQAVRSARTLELRPLTTADLALIVTAAKLSFLNAAPELRDALHTACTRLLRTAAEETHLELANLARACKIRGVESPGASDIVQTLLLAIRERKQVRIVYDPRGSSQRVATKVAPYYLVAAPSGWTLVGRSSVHRSEREFSLAAIQSMELTNEYYRSTPSPR